MARSILTAADIEPLARGAEVVVPRDAIVTDEARERARERGVRIRVEESVDAPSAGRHRPVVLGADHGGYELKEFLKRFLLESGYEARDLGTDSTASVDYPDFAGAVAQTVASGAAWRGIVIDSAGIGSAIAANKVPGVRAAQCYDRATARNSREHNDANVLSLGARLLTPEQAREIVRVWLETEFAGGRHQRRVDKITALERAARS
ncbi:MAG: ribose 5-phosphate isomerase B [Candidatus Acidiferrales bacterium]|nr:ribose 5-phosphate isomerase B [Acidobacteriota bacterium]MCH8946710.1 ribose 5-phosphate isomerase B [Acidobacteriota bacterium]